ncbi:hypothetical protein JCM11641_002132 [Rhodosporidiobolus odoratus]
MTSAHPGQAHCLTILDSFALPVEAAKPFLGDVTSRDMRDCAAVLELVGPSLAQWQRARPSPFFPLLLASPSTISSCETVTLGGFNFAVSVQSTGDHCYTRPGDWDAASAETLLLADAQYHGEFPVRPVDIWAVGGVTSLLLFARNLALEVPPSLADERHSSSRGPKVWGLPACEVIALASLDPDAGWPSFFSDAQGQMHSISLRSSPLRRCKNGLMRREK